MQNSAPAGFQYDAAGNVTSDALNQYRYDADGRVCAVEQSVAGVVTMTGYVYDAEGNRVAKGTITSLSCDMTQNGFQQSAWSIVGQSGEQVTETDGQGNWQHSNVYADGHMIATYDTGGLHFQLSDWLGTRRVETDYAGNTQLTCGNMPFGDSSANCVTPTEQFFTGYARDTESGNDYAQARYYASGMGRFIAPDPYNGSYDINNPQSLNRYAYVNANPLGLTDPNGLAGAGILTGVGGAPCKALGSYSQSSISIPLGFDGLSLNPCNPVGSAIADGVVLGAAAIDVYQQAGQTVDSVITAWKVDSETGLNDGYDSTFSGIAATVQAAITIACSIDSNSDLCGQSGWTSDLIGGDAGKVVNDSIAVAGAVACFAGPEACLGYGIYTVANDLFSVFWNAFGPPKFTGSLLPRPGVPGVQGSSSFGVPVHNLRILGKPPSDMIPSPGMMLP